MQAPELLPTYLKEVWAEATAITAGFGVANGIPRGAKLRGEESVRDFYDDTVYTPYLLGTAKAVYTRFSEHQRIVYGLQRLLPLYAMRMSVAETAEMPLITTSSQNPS